jgi:hypothetical protein
MKYTRFTVHAAALALLTSCASPTSSQRPPPVPAAPPPQSAATDPSYDWHVLVMAPFGMLLKDSPIPLHEVLLFHDDAPGGAAGNPSSSKAEVENKDCYTSDRSAPRFVGQQPAQYLLCFDHDRLSRVEASVQLAADQAPQVFARACALWLKSTAPSAGSGTTCEGREGSTAFSGRLALVPGEAAATFSVTLVGDSGNEHPAP